MKVAVSGYFGFGNIGDEAIKDVIKSKLEQNGIEAFFLTNSKENDHEVKRDDFLEITKTIKNVDALISGGGGLLQDKTSSRSLYYYLGIIKLAQLFKKPNFIFAQGIGPIYKSYNRFLTKIILNACTLITVRDRESKDLLKNLGVKNEIFVTQDVAFLYNPKPVETIDLKSPYNVLQIKDDKNINIEEVSDIARFMHYKTDIETVIVPFYKGEDLKIAKEIEKRTKFRVFVPANVDEAFAVLNGAKIVVGMRYHSIVFSLLLNKLIIPIFYDEKNKHLSSYFGLTGLDVKDFRLTNFSKIFEQLIKEEEAFKTNTVEKLLKAKEDANENFRLLFKYLY